MVATEFPWKITKLGILIPQLFNRLLNGCFKQVQVIYLSPLTLRKVIYKLIFFSIYDLNIYEPFIAAQMTLTVKVTRLI